MSKIEKDIRKTLEKIKFNSERVGKFSHVANGTSELSKELLSDLHQLEEEIEILLSLYEDVCFEINEAVSQYVNLSKK